jgi:hypothetical protein
MWATYAGNFQLGTGIAGVKDGGGSWTASSDARIKKNVTDYEKGLADLEQLRPVSFQYNGLFETADNGVTHVGLIAQDVQQTSLADMVGEIERKDGKILTVDPSQLVFALINAVKALDARVKALEAQGQP